jgi:hypothetical protein
MIPNAPLDVIPTASYFEQLPRVVTAAHAFWLGMRRRVPLEWLLEIGSAQLRAALADGKPLVLDFATPVLDALRSEAPPTPRASRAEAA